MEHLLLANLHRWLVSSELFSGWKCTGHGCDWLPESHRPISGFISRWPRMEPFRAATPHRAPLIGQPSLALAFCSNPLAALTDGLEIPEKKLRPCCLQRSFLSTFWASLHPWKGYHYQYQPTARRADSRPCPPPQSKMVHSPPIAVLLSPANFLSTTSSLPLTLDSSLIHASRVLLC
jgi:hypothetical protein